MIVKWKEVTNGLKQQKKIFDPNGKLKTSLAVEKDSVQSLCKLLTKRFHEHLLLRLDDEDKRNHWCWNFFKDNVCNVCHLLLFFNMIKEDFVCADSGTCLIGKPSEFVEIDDDNKALLQGAHLHRDTSNDAWIRSGKCVGWSFEARLKEHQKGAEEQKASFI